MSKAPSASRQRHASILEVGLTTLIALLPLSTFLTVWIASSGFDALAVSSWKEVLVVLLSAFGLYLALTDRRLLIIMLGRSYNQLIGAYIAIHLLYVLFADDKFLAFAGLATNVRFLLCFLAAQVVVYYRADFAKRLKRLVIILGTAVAAIGGLQALLLPRELLTHFGYELPGFAKDGVPPAYHLVGGTDLVRAQATLRGPNVLGAYLILPFTLLLSRSKFWLAGAIGVVILLSHSRSAWLAAALATGIYMMDKLRAKFSKRLVAGIVGVFIGIGLLLGVVAMTPTGQRVLLHDSGSSVEDSNQGHWRAVNQGLKQFFSEPLGRGVGTAGPVSVRSNETRIAENYFIQIGQEIGWLGLALLLAIHAAVGYGLWRQKSMALLAALIGIIVTNMLLHTWADEAVAITWWTMAGAYLGRK